MPEIKLNDKELKLHLDNRSKFSSLLIENANYFGTQPISKLKAIFPLKYNNAFEQLGCIGYQPVMEELTATIKLTRSTGYSGDLCSNGSMQYVRFFLDYGDGVWKDMGQTAVNVHDIPDTKDCDGKIEKPLSYVVRVKIDPKQFLCSKPNLPRLRAVLSWNTPLAENVPFPLVAWGDAKEATIQIAPLMLLNPLFPIETIGSLLAKAIQNPNVSLNTLAATTFKGNDKLVEATSALVAPKVELAELAKNYAKLKIEPERMGVKILDEAVTSNNQAIMMKNNEIFTSAGLNWAESLKKFIALKGNVTYEELYCVGADYHKEALVATLLVKKQAGYSGDLCKKGSKEYVGFWIQTEPECKWVYVGTSFVTAHDVASKDGISYSAILPFDFSKFRKPCGTPIVLKVRGVLSWNVAPSTTDPNKVPYWGNIVDSYVQIAPQRKGWDGKSPVIITMGGVSLDNINDTTGLTSAGAKIEFNQSPLYAGSPFGGTIVIQGVSDPLAGMKYRVKVRNLNTGSEYYVNGGLQLLGYDPSTNQIIHPIIFPNNSTDNYYTYQPYLKNIDSILARFNPGTNDLLEITVEHENGTSVSHRIQMDNNGPNITLTIDKSGCGGYAKGDIIHGTYSVNESFLLSYSLYSSFGGPGISGTTNVANGTFSFPTAGASPCGNIGLIAYEKTVWNSVGTGNYAHTSETICLK